MIPIYQTQNTALAVTLATCGVPFDQHPVSREPLPFVNIYTRETLLKFLAPVIEGGKIVQRPRYKGWEMEKAALDAWKRGLHGLLMYCFQRVDPFEAILKSWDKHSASIDLADEQAGGVGSQNVSILTGITPATAAAICCQFAKNRKALLVGWKTATPWINYPGAVETRHEGGKEYRVGSMKLHTLGASRAVKEKIGL